MTIYAKEAVAVWKSGTAFDITAGSGATMVTDGDAKVGMSPMEVMLAALIGCTGADVAEILDQQGIAVRAGHHCAQPFMEQMNIPGTVRVSLAPYNTLSEIRTFLNGLKKVEELL